MGKSFLPMAEPAIDAAALKRLKNTEYRRRYRAKYPEKTKAAAAALYQKNREKINEPKRRANFEAIERDRERKAKAKGLPFVPRAYEVYTTDDPRNSYGRGLGDLCTK